MKYPGGLYRLFVNKNPWTGRQKPDLQGSIKLALIDGNPSKKTALFLNIASNIFTLDLNNESLRTQAKNAVESDIADSEDNKKLLKYLDSNNKDDRWDALKATLNLDNKPIPKAKILAYIASDPDIPYIRRADLYKYACEELKNHNLAEISTNLNSKSKGKLDLWTALKKALEMQDQPEYLAIKGHNLLFQ